jgi:DNA-binding MarR family transcriptional regulator
VAKDKRDARETLIQRLWLLGELESTETAQFHQRAAQLHGLGVTEMKALGFLLRQGPCHAGDLVHELQVTSGAVTGVVDRLERRGLAHRRADSEDGRRVVIEADTRSLAGLDNVYVAIGKAFSALYETYTTRELEFLARHSEAAVALIREQTAALETKAAAARKRLTAPEVRSPARRR